MDLMTALFASQLNGKDAGLPSVDSADNGKILKVIEGEWNKGDADNQIEIIEGTKNSEDTTVTLDKSFSEIKALIEDGNIPIIAVTGLPYAGKNYYVLNNKYDGTTVNKQVNFIFSGTDCKYNSVTNVLEIKNIHLGLDETENNVARVINNNADVTFGSTRTVLYEPPAGDVGTLFDAQGDTLLLTEDVRNYDEIIIIPAVIEGNNDFYCTSEQTFRVADLLIPATQRNDLGMGIRFRAFRSTGNEEAIARLIFDNDNFPGATPYQTLWCEGASGIYGPYIHRVIGIKY